MNELIDTALKRRMPTSMFHKVGMLAFSLFVAVSCLWAAIVGNEGMAVFNWLLALLNGGMAVIWSNQIYLEYKYRREISDEDDQLLG